MAFGYHQMIREHFCMIDQSSVIMFSTINGID